MITLQKIVESIETQMKPHLKEDVIVHRPFLIEMIHQSRAALIRKLYSSNENYYNYYQEVQINSVTRDSVTITGNTLNFDYAVEVITLPSVVLVGAGKKNIQYLGSADRQMNDIDYCNFEEFMNYEHHRFGSHIAAYTILSNEILIRNAKGQEIWVLRGLFEYPDRLPGYVYQTSRYPISLNDLRNLEIITLQHLIPKLGLPVDLLNSGQDETNNAPVLEQVKQLQQQPLPDEQQ